MRSSQQMEGKHVTKKKAAQVAQRRFRSVVMLKLDASLRLRLLSNNQNRMWSNACQSPDVETQKNKKVSVYLPSRSVSHG